MMFRKHGLEENRLLNLLHKTERTILMDMGIVRALFNLSLNFIHFRLSIEFVMDTRKGILCNCIVNFRQLCNKKVANQQDQRF